MAKIELSKKIFPGEGISFAEKLKQIKILDKDVAYEQLIRFANMVSACLEVYGEENVVWQDRDLHSLITPIVSISGHGVKAPPPPPLPPPPPPNNFKTAPKNSIVVKAQNLLELFEKNTFSVDKFKDNFVSLSRSIKSVIEFDLNNKLTSEEDINNLIKQYNADEKNCLLKLVLENLNILYLLLTLVIC